MEEDGGGDLSDDDESSRSEPDSDGDRESNASSEAAEAPAPKKKKKIDDENHEKPQKEVPKPKGEPKRATRKPRAVKPQSDEFASRWPLAGCRGDVMLAQAAECPGLLPGSEELLQKNWNACKPLWFKHPVDELADRLKGALASQPEKTVGNQACFQRKVPLQAQDVPLDLHELFPMIDPLAEDLFAGEERLALAFLQLHKQDMEVLRGYMQLRRMDAGPVWSSVSVGDLNFGRFMYVCSGRMFPVPIACMMLMVVG